MADNRTREFLMMNWKTLKHLSTFEFKHSITKIIFSLFFFGQTWRRRDHKLIIVTPIPSSKEWQTALSAQLHHGGRGSSSCTLQ